MSKPGGTGSEIMFDGADTVLTAVAAALRQQSRRSVHPSDQADLLETAHRIATALEHEFHLTPRNTLASVEVEP